MLSTLLVIGGVLVGLLLLLALIVGLSSRPAPSRRGPAAGRGVSTPTDSAWTAHAGRPHPDAWSEPEATSELPAVR